MEENTGITRSGREWQNAIIGILLLLGTAVVVIVISMIAAKVVGAPPFNVALFGLLLMIGPTWAVWPSFDSLFHQLRSRNVGGVLPEN